MSSVLRSLRRVFAKPPSRPRTDHLGGQHDLGKLVAEFKKLSRSTQFRRNNVPYEKTVQRLAYHRQFALIEDLLEHQKQYVARSSDKFAVRLIGLYGKAGMFEHARKLFDEMPSLAREPSLVHLNALLAACVDSRKFDKVEEIFRQLPEKLSLDIDVCTYNAVIKGYCLMGDLDSALSLLDEMERKGIEPNLISWNTLLEAYYGSGRLSDGEKIWDLMVSKDVTPSVRSYNPRLRGILLQNRVADAVKLLDEMRDKGIEADTHSYNAFIIRCCRNGDLDGAKKWYGRLVESKCNVDRVTVSALFPLLCEKGDYELAHRLCIKAMDQKLLRGSDTLQNVVDLLVRESKVDLATEIVEHGKAKKTPYNLKLPQAA
ncbi:pentatricopeptide repeat-containing protein At3g13160, mitochondrial-like [Rhodamnia argentea]|uniref:Pentatricopeptide repeat-containing protein At3g13160, mitochondrial-like n=1 Tax=Rhodamnia argentea TaxID=178133 RepID=A0ABM3HYV8_9MYRT|nr:pentatricopeptide repeat-containing protein At3g13160, mitochondrial-like [Rhodamnia argentea]